MRELFIDCSMGAAGDMIAASLLELFEDRQSQIDRLNSLGIPGVRYSLESVQRYSITGSHLSVMYMGAEEEQDCHNHGHHHHNGIKDIFSIVDGLNMEESEKTAVKEVYTSIAKAEGKVHGCEMESIHFHELGTMDAVADISAVCWLISQLRPGRISASPICTGFGTVSCAHGVMPVPAPATAILLQGTECFAGNLEGELCTPTGAALIKHFASAFGRLPGMTVTASGYGMGKKDFGQLSCVRAFLGESEETILELCCNVDDMSPEDVGFAIDRMLAAGAPDVYYQPVGMKKNRPGVLLVCLCRESQRDEMVELIFKHTSTIGIRETLCRRYVLKRREELVATEYGELRFKLSEGYGVERRKAEYDDLARIAREQNISLRQLRKDL